MASHDSAALIENEPLAPLGSEGEETRGDSSFVPRPPDSLEETGLSEESLTDLILKTLYSRGSRLGKELADILALSFPILDDVLLTLQHGQLVEVRGSSGHGREGYTFAITGAGMDRAREAMEINGYVGPAPVPLDAYRSWVEKQSQKDERITRKALSDAFGDLVLKPGVIDRIGPAVNSGSSIFLYGAPGNGKTATAERIARLVSDTVFIPHAVDVNGEVMVLFDPAHHEVIEDDRDEPAHAILRNPEPHDPRFVKIRRPSVVVGGELTMDQLDLQRDPDTKVYHAPFQLKATHGVLIIDDFGRQRMQPHELLNRWIVPLEKRVDYLSLSTGVKFTVPFDCIPIFSTNLDPVDLVDEAFLRRIRYKIEFEDPSRDEFAAILEDVCSERGIQYVPEIVELLFSKYYEGFGIPPRCCHPRDIVDHVEAAASFAGEEPELTHEAVDLAAMSYFLIMARTKTERAMAEGQP